MSSGTRQCRISFACGSSRLFNLPIPAHSSQFSRLLSSTTLLDAMPMADYTTWRHDDLVKRVMALEAQLRNETEQSKRSPEPPARPRPSTSLPPKQQSRQLDPSRYTTHHIALKLAYIGAPYRGFEHHNNNPDPSGRTAIEEELWRALKQTHLIFPTATPPDTDPPPGKEHWQGPVNWAGLEYSKCGRTDRGVSAFGQVIALRVRSARPLRCSATAAVFDPVRSEINYPALLNRVLPATIRVLAWCPVPTTADPSRPFSARFSCRERRYRYFFTQPVFLPTPGPRVAAAATLDIAAMRRAAAFLVGSHDFRNFCKIDAAKQLKHFMRRVTLADVVEVGGGDLPRPDCGNGSGSGDGDGAGGDGAAPVPAPEAWKVFALRLHGSAFLWHQVRCIMAVLFLVGQGHEKPEVVRSLLDVSAAGAGAGGRPQYTMADDKPLVLWDCIFPVDPATGEVPPIGWVPEGGEMMRDSLPWITPGMQELGAEAVWGNAGLMGSLWSEWRSAKMDELLAACLFDKAAECTVKDVMGPWHGARHTRVFEGGNFSHAMLRYRPLMERERLETPESLNARYAAKKRAAAMACGDDDDAAAARSGARRGIECDGKEMEE